MTLPVRPGATARSGACSARSRRGQDQVLALARIARVVIGIQPTLLDPAGGLGDLAVGQGQPRPLCRHGIEQADHRGTELDPLGLGDRLQGPTPVASGLPDPRRDGQAGQQRHRVGELPAQRDALGGVVQGAVQLASAGLFLDGEAAWRDRHAVNGMPVLPLLALFQVALAILVWRRDGGPGWLPVAGLGLLPALLIQSMLGQTGQVAVHVPLGLAIFGLIGTLLTRARSLTGPAEGTP